MTPAIHTLSVATRDGTFIASYTAAGLCRLSFPASGQRARLSQAAALPLEIRRWHAQLGEALKLALAGRNPAALPPLDLGGTRFQRSVWTVLRTIESGRTLSYGEVAKAVGRPGASRAVGAACGANPLPVLIPCHRVLAAGGKIGGFSGGMKWKRLLLAREGRRF